jgi:hypothetical protein
VLTVGVVRCRVLAGELTDDEFEDHFIDDVIVEEQAECLWLMPT